MSKSIGMLVVAALLLGATAGSVSAQATTFIVKEGKQSRVRFVSDAPLETISGVAKSTRGDDDTRRCDLVRTHRACAYERDITLFSN